MKRLIYCLSFVIAPTLSQAASFDCNKASSSVEKTICGDPKLNRLDDALGENYKYISASNIGDGARKDLKATQRVWIIERNKCLDTNCLVTSYKKRLNEICDYPVLSGVAPVCKTTEEIEAEFSTPPARQAQQTLPPRSEPSPSKQPQKALEQIAKAFISDCNDMLYEKFGITRLTMAAGNANRDINDELFERTLTPLLRSSPDIAADIESSLGRYGICDKFGKSELIAKFRDAVNDSLKQKNQAQQSLISSHSTDTLAIDYAAYQTTVGGQVKTPKSAAGSMKKITLGEYLSWEQQQKTRMQKWIKEGVFAPKVWVGNNLVEATTIRSRTCADDITKQWTASFGYDHTTLRGSILSNGFVDLRKAISIICADV